MRAGASRGTVASVCVFLLVLSIYGRAQGAGPAQPPLPPGRAHAEVDLPTSDLENEPKLRNKVWLVAPDNTVERTLTELMARINPQLHLKLGAMASVQSLPVSCYVAGLPLKDLLAGLTVYTRLHWHRTADNTLTLGLPSATPAQTVAAHEAAQSQIAYFGMRVVKAVAEQPADLSQLLQQGLVRLGSVPSPVQQAVQTLCAQQAVQAQFRTGDSMPIGPIHTPLDPQTTGIQLTETFGGGVTGYRLHIDLAQPVDQRPYKLNMGLMFTPQQATAYHPASEQIVAPPLAAHTARLLSQPVTLNLHAATSTEALRALFNATRTPLLAVGMQPSGHADFSVTKLPLRDALDRLCGTYGLRWEQQQSGLILFWVAPDKMPDAPQN